nr:hypothetical protein [Chlamydiota bacterium]
MKKILFFALSFCALFAEISLGIENLFETDIGFNLIKNKRIGVLTHDAAISKDFQKTMDLFLQHQKHFSLKCFFAPEHGISGNFSTIRNMAHEKIENIIVYSLYGKDIRPSKEMLQDLDIIVCDMQDIGARSYTYITTLFYVMEEAAKHNVEVIVCDRPNPLGNIVDGPMLEENTRSFVGYINVPYCHGMTIGELALFFNEEYNTHCKLKVVPMEGYKRNMTFFETQRAWIPTSQYLPESDTPFFYSLIGIIGELQFVNIGIGYTQPFKLIGAPWIDAKAFAKKLNEQNLVGLHFQPKIWTPFYGSFKDKTCHGVQVFITDYKNVKPVSS